MFSTSTKSFLTTIEVRKASIDIALLSLKNTTETEVGFNDLLKRAEDIYQFLNKPLESEKSQEQ